MNIKNAEEALGLHDEDNKQFKEDKIDDNTEIQRDNDASHSGS